MNMEPTYSQLNLNSSKKTKQGTFFGRCALNVNNSEAKNLCRKERTAEMDDNNSVLGASDFVRINQRQFLNN